MQIKKIELSHGWEGWSFGPWGRAKAWRLFDPNGTFYLPGEILELQGLSLDLDLMRSRVRTLEGLVAAQNAYFDTREVATLRAAAALLSRLPGARLRIAA